ncbi:hypothetical protein HDV05_003904 [Chytridiales sp. JEL 0842]|nr:hypothetical protein HDV05_003904 [Chytridiales sp. JEL 0842]
MKLVVGDQTFTIRSTKQTSVVDVYKNHTAYRSPTDKKNSPPNDPVPSHLTIVGKVTHTLVVVPNRTSARQQMATANSIEAERHKSQRSAVILDDAKVKQLTSSTSKPQKASGTQSRRSISVNSIHKPLSKSAPALTVPVESIDPEFKSKLIHLLAPKPITHAEIVKKLGAALEPQILTCLGVVAKTQSDGTLVLKNKTYLEVYPFRWETYSYKDRITVVQNARIAFGSLQLPPDAPEWKNLEEPQYSSPGSSLSGPENNGSGKESLLSNKKRKRGASPQRSENESPNVGSVDSLTDLRNVKKGRTAVAPAKSAKSANSGVAMSATDSESSPAFPSFAQPKDSQRPQALKPRSNSSTSDGVANGHATSKSSDIEEDGSSRVSYRRQRQPSISKKGLTSTTSEGTDGSKKPTYEELRAQFLILHKKQEYYYEQIQPIIELSRSRHINKYTVEELKEKFHDICREGVFDDDLKRGLSLQKAAAEMKRRFDEARSAALKIKNLAWELYGPQKK